MTTRYFHFTLGPVQGFVAQARRSRDFWAGSFILSWLSGVAMYAVRTQKGEIIFPKADENFLAWLGGKKMGVAPRQGNIPNRFKAKVPNDFDPRKVEESVQIAWYELAELVWRKDLVRHNLSCKTTEIWNQQIEHFWEISWALSDNQDESDLLDRRKNWRNHFVPEQLGVKCTMMEGWQELSGIERPDKKRLEKFWQPIQEKLKRDLAKNEHSVYEHLCAIAFVKRRFAYHFGKLGHEIKPIRMPGGWKLKGWNLDIGIPSVSLMAAVPWLKKVIKTEDVSLLIELANELGVGNQEVPIKALNGKLKTSDGDVFFENELSNQNEYPDDKVERMLNVLQKIAIKPSPFYAILLMDGDSLGKKMGKPENQQPISDALQTFTQKVPSIVYDNDGFLIYAGGDDVLAILPITTVLQCATEVRQAYQNAFKDKKSELQKSTISAAIEFVHTHTPLTTMLKDAHDLLDNVAKEKTERDAVAVRVWKRSGKALEWAMKWEGALKNNRFQIESLSEQFQDEAFSNKFFYHIREHFELLNKEPKILSPDDECALLATDYMNSGVNDTRIKEKQLDFDKAKEEIKPLLELCRQNDVLKPDGALLVRFLAKEGMKYK
ncbi:MAG: type III-B CRISPR-associated protein Cas10/Cmr2 [Pseudomonadota bacterium]